MIELTVNDMTCGHCASRVTQAMKSVDEQAKVSIDTAGRASSSSLSAFAAVRARR